MQLVARRHRAPRTAFLGASMLVLAACGGDNGDAAEAEAPGDGTSEASDDASDGDGDVLETGDGEDDAEGGEDVVIPADVTEENGMATMRPSSETSPACEGIDRLEPGASFAFPTDDAGILDAGPGPVRVEFVGCSNTFEANLVYDAFHGEDRGATLTESTTGGSMGDWGDFSFEETFWTPGRWTVVIYEDDAATGDRQEYDRVTFSID